MGYLFTCFSEVELQWWLQRPPQGSLSIIQAKIWNWISMALHVLLYNEIINYLVEGYQQLQWWSLLAFDSISRVLFHSKGHLNIITQLFGKWQCRLHNNGDRITIHFFIICGVCTAPASLILKLATASSWRSQDPLERNICGWRVYYQDQGNHFSELKHHFFQIWVPS